MMLPRAFFACSLTLAAASMPAPRQQPPRLVLSDDADELDRALAAPTPARQMPVRIAAASLPADDPSVVRLLVTAEIDDRQEGLSLASVAYVVLTGNGQRAAYALRRRELRRTGSGPLSFVEIVSVPPAAYRVRLAAMRNGRIGAAEARAVAHLQSAAGVRVGDLLVGETPGDDVMANVTPGGRLRGDRLVVTLPIAFDRTLPSDIAMTLDVTKSASGTALLSAPLSLVDGEGRSRFAQAVADTRVLPSGDYVARVSVKMSGTEVAHVLAPIVLDRAATTTGAGAVVSLAPSFRLEEVLDPAVLGPFLDQLTARAAEHARPAIERAKAGRFAEAVEATSSNDPNDPARPFLQGLSLLSRKQLQAASDAFRETLRASPDYFAGEFYIGACYAAGGRDSEAANAWQISLVGLEQYPIVFRLLSDAFTRMGQPDRAIEALEEASAKWPDDKELRLRLARAALGAQRYGRVNEIVDASLARPPADPDLLLVGMQAIFEDVTHSTSPPPDDALPRLKRYRDAYVAAGGSQQPLVNEWVTAVEKKSPRAGIPRDAGLRTQ